MVQTHGLHTGGIQNTNFPLPADMDCVFSGALSQKPWQYKSNAIDREEAKRLKTKFSLSLPSIKTMNQ